MKGNKEDMIQVLEKKLANTKNETIKKTLEQKLSVLKENKTVLK